MNVPLPPLIRETVDERPVATGLVAVLGYALFAAAYRAYLGYDPPLGEVTIGAIVSVVLGAKGLVGYSDLQVKKATIQYSGSAPSTIPPG